MALANAIYTIAPHAPFLDTLADALIGGRVLPQWRREGAFWLSDITIYVPTRRAATALSRKIAERLADAPLLLPDIRPLGGDDPTQEPFLPPYEPLALDPAINRFKRRLLLAQLIAGWLETQGAGAFSAPGLGGHRGPSNGAEILALADSLATVIDDFAIARIDPRALSRIEDAQLPEQWQANLDFVSFVLNAWPDILAGEGEMEGASRTNSLLERKAGSLGVAHGDKPVIVAGSTGSVPATAELIAAIADLPNGAVVLAGLDTTLGETSIAALGTRGRNPHGHPQYGLVRLLARLAVHPGAVIELARGDDTRTRLLNGALALPQDTAGWPEIARALAPDLSRASEPLSVIAARTPEEEARAIALCVRDGLSTGKSVAIVAPDQTLARRICAELARFGIALDDAAGTPLIRARAGRLVRQAVSVVCGGLQPVDIMGLLRNRNVSLSLGRAAVSRGADLIDFGVFRGQRPLPGFAGLRQSVRDNCEGKTPYPALRLGSEDADAALALIDALEAALDPLTRLMQAEPAPASTIAAALVATLAALRAAPPEEAPSALEGESEFMGWAETAMAQGPRGPKFATEDLAMALEGLLAGPSVRPPRAAAEDVMVFGRLEARLMSADRMILAGLIEGVWPEIADPGPWLSRGMRLAAGLEPPEKLHGLAAHDFLMAAGHGEVVFTLPERSGTAPATPSRLIQRIEALVGDDCRKAMVGRGQRWVEMARALDATGQPARPAARPAPIPPASVRPRSLSITEAETLLRSPYDLYARHVLDLRRVDPLGADPDMAERGTLIHQILGDFIVAGHDPRAPDAHERLMAMAHDAYRRLDGVPARRDLWLARFSTMARAYIGYERGRRPMATRRAEIRGELELKLAERFTLRGRADRIDRDTLGALDIIDFKTGQPPTPKEMKQFFAPQLPLEAAMARAGAFGPDLAHETETMAYLKLSHGPDALVEKPFSSAEGMSLSAMIGETFMRFQRHVEVLLLSDRLAMTARVLPKPGQRFKGDYEHLARTEEWTLIDADDEQDA